MAAAARNWTPHLKNRKPLMEGSKKGKTEGKRGKPTYVEVQDKQTYQGPITLFVVPFFFFFFQSSGGGGGVWRRGGPCVSWWTAYGVGTRATQEKGPRVKRWVFWNAERWNSRVTLLFFCGLLASWCLQSHPHLLQVFPPPLTPFRFLERWGLVRGGLPGGGACPKQACSGPPFVRASPSAKLRSNSQRRNNPFSTAETHPQVHRAPKPALNDPGALWCAQMKMRWTVPCPGDLPWRGSRIFFFFFFFFFSPPPPQPAMEFPPIGFPRRTVQYGLFSRLAPPGAILGVGMMNE